MMLNRRFPRTPESVPTARHFVTESVVDVPQEILERVALLVSELATNAIRHGGTDFVVRVEQTDAEIAVEIADAGTGTPTVRNAEPRDPSGRGLQIVEALSDSWGVRAEPNGEGKAVWFTLSLAR
jgi:anti-sigma regulatory factor (Ser/Thr protein kinase)